MPVLELRHPSSPVVAAGPVAPPAAGAATYARKRPPLQAVPDGYRVLLCVHCS